MKARYGGVAVWAGNVTFELPKQSHTRRLVYVATVCSIEGGALPTGGVLKVYNGANDVLRHYVAGGLLTDGVTFDTMLLWAEENGNETNMCVQSIAQINCALGKDIYIDAGTRITVDLDAPPPSGDVTISWLFEDVD